MLDIHVIATLYNELTNARQADRKRQEERIELTASEKYAGPRVMDLCSIEGISQNNDTEHAPTSTAGAPTKEFT
jgi:glycine/serine hydroxymethyltransferase